MSSPPSPAVLAERVPHDRRVTTAIGLLVAAPPIAAVFLLGIGYPPGSETSRAILAFTILVAALLAGSWLVQRRRQPDRPGAIRLAWALVAVNVLAMVAAMAYLALVG